MASVKALLPYVDRGWKSGMEHPGARGVLKLRAAMRIAVLHAHGEVARALRPASCDPTGLHYLLVRLLLVLPRHATLGHRGRRENHFRLTEGTFRTRILTLYTRHVSYALALSKQGRTRLRPRLPYSELGGSVLFKILHVLGLARSLDGNLKAENQ